jgi:hypothetical protein
MPETKKGEWHKSIMEQNKINKSKLAFVLLAILLLIAIGYIAIDKWQDYKQLQYIKAYQDGYSAGVYNAVVSLYQQTEKCQATTINVGNATRQVADAACLKAG